MPNAPVVAISLAADLARSVNGATIADQQKVIRRLQANLFLARSRQRRAERRIPRAENAGYLSALRDVANLLNSNGQVTRVDLRALAERRLV